MLISASLSISDLLLYSSGSDIIRESDLLGNAYEY